MNDRSMKKRTVWLILGGIAVIVCVLWWAYMDVTTVGSNIIAVTPTGRVLSVLLAALGMMMFPIFTVYVTSLVERRYKEKEEFYKKAAQKPAPKADAS